MNLPHPFEDPASNQPLDPDASSIVGEDQRRLFQQVWLEQLDTLEKQRSYPDLFSRLVDDAWIEVYLRLVDAQCRFDLYQAVRYSLAFLLAASFYRSDACPRLVAVIQPFEHKIGQPYLDWWQTSVHNLLYLPEDIHYVAPAIDELKQLEQLIRRKKLVFLPPCEQYTEQLCATLHWQMGEIYRPYDEPKAISYYQKALATFYQGEEYTTHLAQLYWTLAYDQGKKQAYQQSIEYLKQALRLKPEFAEAHYNLGNAYYQIGQYDTAIISYQYAIELESTNVDAWINLGNAHVQCKAYQSAIDEYTYAQRHDSQNAMLYFNRGNAYQKKRLYQEALQDFTTAIELHPPFIGAYVNRGNAYAALKMRPQATADYKKASELAPDDLHPAWMCEWIKFDQQPAGPETAHRLETLALLDPEHYISVTCRGIAHGLQTREIKMVLPELDQAISQAPEQWDPYFWRCMLCAHLGRYKQAKQDLLQALANGLPELLLLPLYWLKENRPDFFTSHARPVLDEANL